MKKLTGNVQKKINLKYTFYEEKKMQDILIESKSGE